MKTKMANFVFFEQILLSHKIWLRLKGNVFHFNFFFFVGVNGRDFFGRRWRWRGGRFKAGGWSAGPAGIAARWTAQHNNVFRDNFGAVSFNAVLTGPIAGLQAAFNVDLAAFV